MDMGDLIGGDRDPTEATYQGDAPARFFPFDDLHMDVPHVDDQVEVAPGRWLRFGDLTAPDLRALIDRQDEIAQRVAA